MDNSVYDYIVVGAGSAGCVVARRLIEKHFRVLLIEAGTSDNNPYIHIPMGYGKLFKNKKINWCYEGEPEPFLNNRRSYQPRGKVLGGTGSINGMIYVRGQPEDFDAWESAGCYGWGFDSVLPYFKKSQNQVRGESYYHGINGPLWVSDLPSKDELADAFIESSHNLGSSYNYDFNGETQEGTGYYQVTTKNNKRWSPAQAFLRNHNFSEYLKIQKNTQVIKINIEDKLAKGVECIFEGKKINFHANKEVIISGGTINSPQILMLSGIGDSRELQKFDIPVIHHSPFVGKRLQDHFGVVTEYKCNKPITVNDLYHSNTKRVLAAIKYFLFKSGPLASNGNFANTFIKTNSMQATPDMMISFMAWCTGEDLGEPKPFSAFTVLAEHSRPQSKGFVKLKSPDALKHPAIQFNFFESQEDRDAIVAGVKYARKISNTDPLKNYIIEEINPGPTIKTDKEIEEYCQRIGGSLLHCVGTCFMGSEKDSVVDNELRVRGVRNLRVVDASIMPKIVSGNTQAATIMIAEKGSDNILRETRN